MREFLRLILIIVNGFGLGDCSQTMISVPVLNRPISETDDGIRATDITFQTLPVAVIPKDTVLDAAQLLGKIACHQIIPPHQPIRASHLKPAIVIRKGDLVQVCYRNRCLIITTFAKATHTAAMGECVTLETLPHAQSKDKEVSRSLTLITAVATGPRRAEISHDRA
jgi:flagella basal body P-ring formation protein FlgA